MKGIYLKGLVEGITSKRFDKSGFIKVTIPQLLEICADHSNKVCPVWQCGGKTVVFEREVIKSRRDVEHDGDWQTPDMICLNCGAHYQFKGFNKKKQKEKMLDYL